MAKSNNWITDTKRFPVKDESSFFTYLIKVWSLSLPEDRRLSERETEIMVYMLVNGNGLGEMVDYTKGTYRKQLEKDFGISRQGFSNFLHGIVKKKWLRRRHDEFLNRYDYIFPKEIIRVREAYFEKECAGMVVTLQFEFNAAT
jgi:DNA-binding MarR family transcriptional regulator